MRARIKSAPLPEANEIGLWVTFGDGQTGKLEDANDRGDVILWILDNCQAEQLAAAKAIDTRPFWQKWMKPLKPG